MATYLTTTEAAANLGVTRARIHQWITDQDGQRIKATMICGRWAILAKDCRRPKKKTGGRKPKTS